MNNLDFLEITECEPWSARVLPLLGFSHWIFFFSLLSGIFIFIENLFF